MRSLKVTTARCKRFACYSIPMELVEYDNGDRGVRCPKCGLTFKRIFHSVVSQEAAPRHRVEKYKSEQEKYKRYTEIMAAFTS